MRTKPLRRRSLPSLATLRHTIRLSLLALLGSVVSLTPLHANVLFTFQEVGSDVVATTSGSIGTGWSSPVAAPQVGSGNSFLSSDAIIGQSSAGGERFYGSSGLFTLNNELSGFSRPIQDGVATGDFFGYSGSTNFFTPAGIGEGESFSPDTTITWANETFASLGLDTSLSETPLVLFTLNNPNNDTISGALIPEPSSYGFLLGAVGLATAIFCRRRRARTD